MEMIRMNKLFPLEQVLSDENMLFSYYLSDETTYPILEDIEFSTDNDVDYFIGFSSDKYISPLMFKFVEYALDMNGYTIDDLICGNIEDYSGIYSELFGYLAPIIVKRFGVKWKKLFDALNTTYNPLENYSMEEIRTPDITKQDTFDTTDERTPNITREDTFDTTDERTADLVNTENGTIGKTAESTSGVYGFNSTGSNPSNDTDGNETTTITDHTNAETGTDTTTKSGTITNTETGSDTSTKSGTITNTETGTETLTRSGNIGVTTSQQMLESEFEVRKHDFFALVYKDIDSLLCLKIY